MIRLSSVSTSYLPTLNVGTRGAFNAATPEVTNGYRRCDSKNSIVVRKFHSCSQSTALSRPLGIRVLPSLASSSSSFLHIPTAKQSMNKSNSLWYSSTRTSADPQNNNDTTSTNMADEYSATATMDEMSFGDTCTIPDFTLECGVTLPKAQIRYRTYGIPPQTTKDTSNVIVICHALTGNASIDTWWSTLLGPNKAFDTDKYHIICCNILGSCYGSTSPISINPNTNQPYGIDFPNITVQDTVRIQLECLQQHLGFQSIQCVIGGSFGGMQTLEYAIQGNHVTATTTNETVPSGSPSTTPYIKSIIPIACNAQHSAWQIAISEIQRQMIYHDEQWSTHRQYHLATSGLQLARQMAMISYRTAIGYSNKFSRRTTTTNTKSNTTTDAAVETNTSHNVPQWEVSNYLKYQGEKFVNQRQFDPITYVKLTQQMDSHDICRNRISGYSSNHATTSDENNVATILRQISIPTLVLGIDSDILYPIKEQELLAKYIPNSKFFTIHSIEGHDGFLIEQQQVGTYIQNFLSSL